MTPLQFVTARWARLGVMFNVKPANEPVDVERLLLDTARLAPAHTRLLIGAVTWVARHGDAVAKHRLMQLIRDELHDDDQPVMGLMLDLARQADPANRTRFNQAIQSCREGSLPRPLSDIEQASPMLTKLARYRASELSRKWGRWCEPFELKLDALRPPAWVMSHNSYLVERAFAGGDLVASILAECATRREPSFPNEAELARRLGASRPAVHQAVKVLQRSGRMTIERKGRSNILHLV